MSSVRMLTTIGSSVALVVALGYITQSSATGLEYILAIPFAMIGFGFTLGMGTLSILLVWFVLGLLMVAARDETRERVFRTLRWLTVVVSVPAVLLWGGGVVIDGLRNNRLVDQKTLYERCMAPITKTVREEYKQCRDGWNSPSIGSRGACSHHGGVVKRSFERERIYQNEPAFCRTDAANRSWIN